MGGGGGGGGGGGPSPSLWGLGRDPTELAEGGNNGHFSRVQF